MSLANIAVIIFIVITLALFAAVEMHSRKQGRRDEAAEQKQEKEAA